MCISKDECNQPVKDDQNATHVCYAEVPPGQECVFNTSGCGKISKDHRSRCATLMNGTTNLSVQCVNESLCTGSAEVTYLNDDILTADPTMKYFNTPVTVICSSVKTFASMIGLFLSIYAFI